MGSTVKGKCAKVRQATSSALCPRKLLASLTFAAMVFSYTASLIGSLDFGLGKEKEIFFYPLYLPTDGQTDRQTIQTDRQYKQTDRQYRQNTDRQTDNTN